MNADNENKTLEKEIIEDEVIEETAVTKKKASKKNKGPKTVVKEEPLSMSGDPLGLSELEKKEEKPSLSPKKRVKKTEEIVVERYNPEIEKGLKYEEVEQRQLAGMINKIEKGSSKTIGGIIFSNVFTFFNLLTFSIAGWLISIGQWKQLFFLAIVLANLTIGILQEINAKKVLDNLSLLMTPTSNVVREDQEQEIGVDGIVIDDILSLSAGKQISTDAVVREGVIEVNEALLTGESDPIIKRKGDTLYSGSFVISGHCYAQVTAIGKDIYIEKITSQAKKYKKPQSQLLKSLKTMIRIIGVFIVPIGATLFYMMYFKNGVSQGITGGELYAIYQSAVVGTAGAMIGMVPSGLFLLTSMALVVGFVRLSENNAYAQELYCIEMLARVDTLCLDKTGTITDGTMKVKGVIEYNSVPKLTLKNLVSAMMNAQNDQNLTSDALEEKFGRAKRIRHKELIPFSSSRKYSAVEFEKFGTFAIGAPEFILKKDFGIIEQEVTEQAKQGYRVLLVAQSENPIEDGQLSGKITPIALITIEDTIRPDAIQTISYFKENGVDVKVISGDNPITVSNISARAGINNAADYISLEGLTDKDVIRAATKYSVFGRVSPQQKRILVEALKDNGRVVAMTGDGVNDILALKEADTSIAMASGSEAARNVSHLVLMDSNFSSMPKVVAEGRRVINNVQRVSTLFLTKTIFSFLLAIIAIIRNGIYPISPIQLNLIDIFAIGIPSFFLALEQNDKAVKGNFLSNIVKAALPGAVVVVINSLIILWLANALGMDSKATSTLISLTATFTSFMVLLRTCLPFNGRRLILFMSMAAIVLAAIIFLPDLLQFSPVFRMARVKDLNPLDLPQLLLLLVLVLATYKMIYIVSNLYGWIKKFFKFIMNKVSSMQ
ncbi:H+ transporting ATPase, P-type ATPase [Alteracholeplasma palmae J233]|uniref:H+ transporting ATPase, P-type ATPase n=1 Tax=Alteracholeplasma palmae (strain ATCC 49389 / J233) TaxID=1318466 RepID=U4KLS0_ALTPJ|nr:HAD-IC family P-type ATPase [Alteracholeplasma palmae]CCV64863.1 H+ transporting ATPase, P-type ATPase [Alteracholeplasma palmae J233]